MYVCMHTEKKANVDKYCMIHVISFLFISALFLIVLLCLHSELLSKKLRQKNWNCNDTYYFINEEKAAYNTIIKLSETQKNNKVD